MRSGFPQQLVAWRSDPHEAGVEEMEEEEERRFVTGENMRGEGWGKEGGEIRGDRGRRRWNVSEETGENTRTREDKMKGEEGLERGKKES